MKHQHRPFSILLVTLLLTAAITSVAASQSRPAASIDLSWNTMNTSGGHAASASYQMEASLGQPIVDRGTSAMAHLSAGFWQIENTGGYRVFLPLVLK